ncbi:MAG: tRNA lysidine(34) synthetase TilS [Candidatus Accumulibacter sp.]|jgi:tRNA(Ile)-lysidine synthase|nr:tRNA lysidine(34) synthetase TilS [Accumulibacter sp.]
MAGTGKQGSREPPEAEATARIDAALKGFFLPRLRPGDRVGVGLSGGLDSVTLLHALWRLSRAGGLPVGVSAVHVHHGISPRADGWADFCRDFCRRLDVPLTVARVEVPRHSREGLEGAARRLRHGVFAAVDADWLALAHHRDDQAETVLLKLLRGAGVSGAAGMPAARAQASGPPLARPLLGIARAVLLRYAQAHGLDWIEDESNDDRRFRRNFLRRDILPRLEREFPGASVSLARAAGHFAEAAALLDELAAQDRSAVSAASGRIAVHAFNRLAPARARNLLRYACGQAGFRAPDAGWIGEALKQLATAGAASEIRLTTADGELRVYRGELYVLPPHAPPPAEPLPWTGQDALPWAGGQLRFAEHVGQGIRRGALAGGLAWVKARQGGERLQPDARRPRRGLRKLLQENAVPPWERERLPLLWIGGRLAWAGLIGCDAAFACAPGEAGILPSWGSEDRGQKTEDSNICGREAPGN